MWKGLKHRDRWNRSWETPIMGHQLHPSPHWLHMCGSATISIHSGHKLAFAMAISQIASQVAYRRYVRRNAVAIYGLGWGSAQCSMLGGLGEGCSMPHCSFSPQCQCRHKSHEFLQQYVSEARNMQFIETKHTQFWGKFDHPLRDGCNMKML